MKNTALIICVFVVLLIATMCLATTMVDKDLVCPLDGANFTGKMIMSTNNGGGMDTDFCVYALGDFPPNFAIQTCPKCLYSGYLSDMEEALSATQKTALNQALQPLRTKYLKDDSSILNPWDKYEIAAFCAEALGQSDATKARLYLSAAWCVRFKLGGNICYEASINEWSSMTDLFREKVNKKMKQLGLDSREQFMLLMPLVYKDEMLMIKESKLADRKANDDLVGFRDLLLTYHKLGYTEKQSALFKKLTTELTSPGQLEFIKSLGELLDKEK